MKSRKPRPAPAPTAGLSPQAQAHVAFMRFGLGPKAESTARLSAADGAAYDACLREIANPQALLIPDEQVIFNQALINLRPGAPAKPDLILNYANCCSAALYSPFNQMTSLLPEPAEVFHTELVARYAKSIEPEVGFAERLVHFWSNHFSINAVKVSSTVGHFERSVIRPRVLGKFADLLKAVYQHPAMICYLDNQLSTGENSPAGISASGKANKLSYNENLGREILELHTLGAYGGYTQADVVSLSKVLTGWSIYYDAKNLATYGQFRFDPRRHEPGPQTVLGVTYSQPDMTQGLAVFDALAAHPATAQHIAFKLIHHFITDEPSPRAVRRLARVFTRTGGDLQAVARALLTTEGAWTAPMTRLVQPLHWQMSMIRGLGFSKTSIMQKGRGFHSIVNQLSQPTWGRITPDGYPDEDYYWRNTGFVFARKDFAFMMVQNALAVDKMVIDPEARAAELLPGVRSDALASTMADMKAKKSYAGSRLVVLFSSPEYMLR
jgi:uncharacterized protein (DUF1800 family)